MSKLGTRKALGEAQRAEAADAFNANGKFVSASKKLLDTKAPAYRAVTTAIARAKGYWRLNTVPYPEKGIRLMKRDKIPDFETAMAGYRTELAEAIAELSKALDAVVQSARANLGDLFNAADYPSAESLASIFRFDFDYPSLAVPEYLKQLNPMLYEAESRRLESRLQEAVAQNEQELAVELNEMVEHLIERLTPGEDGKQKKLNKSATEGFAEFFQRFRAVNVSGNAQLEGLIAQAEAAVQGADPSQLRKDAGLRQAFRERLATVQQTLSGVIVERPARMFSFDDEDADEGEPPT
ncbi:MAG: hypothetical protein IT428_16155 [Planctomycetaceae bacterium]|nr:hypothetical protein [Planctomycetaceae bacterium]